MPNRKLCFRFKSVFSCSIFVGFWGFLYSRFLWSSVLLRFEMVDFQIVPKLSIVWQNLGEILLQFFMYISLNPCKCYSCHEMDIEGVFLLSQKCQVYNELWIQYISEFKSCVNVLSEIQQEFPIQQAALLGLPSCAPVLLMSSFNSKFCGHKLGNSKVALTGWLWGSFAHESYHTGTQNMTQIFRCC